MEAVGEARRDVVGDAVPKSDAVGLDVVNVVVVDVLGVVAGEMRMGERLDATMVVVMGVAFGVRIVVMVLDDGEKEE